MRLSVTSLLEAYRTGRTTPSEVAATVAERIASSAAEGVWITRVEDDTLLAAARALDAADPALPLYGIPFAVKDNFDVEGMPTTAACPGYAKIADRTAPVIQRLLDAGALLVGKTNMDQFATGLVGTRSPYGVGASVFDGERVSGGSSSGSALAVALGEVAFALGTDTAGSGRVPAAFNALVGLKPTRGLLSTRGVVPACASLDCVSILTEDVAGAAAVFDVAEAFDHDDPWSRVAPASSAPRFERLGVPLTEPPFDEPPAATAWAAAIEHARERFELVPVDITPLLEAAPLLYAAWIAERATDLGATIAAVPDGVDATVAAIIAGGAKRRGHEVFAAMHRLEQLRRAAAQIWEQVDALLLPTTPGHPTHAEVGADPFGVNERLGRFTNFVNLMDLAALAVPGPARDDGLPAGVSLLAPAFADRRLLELGARWRDETVEVELPGTVLLAVAGAHMRGLPLNRQLTGRGARYVRDAVTAPVYRLYAMDGDPPRPGLVQVTSSGGAVEVELWRLAPAALGSLLTEVAAPLAIGRVTLAGGEQVSGFVCEGHAGDSATDITELGGWRAYLAASAV